MSRLCAGTEPAVFRHVTPEPFRPSLLEPDLEQVRSSCETRFASCDNFSDDVLTVRCEAIRFRNSRHARREFRLLSVKTLHPQRFQRVAMLSVEGFDGISQVPVGHSCLGDLGGKAAFSRRRDWRLAKQILADHGKSRAEQSRARHCTAM